MKKLLVLSFLISPSHLCWYAVNSMKQVGSLSNDEGNVNKNGKVQ